MLIRVLSGLLLVVALLACRARDLPEASQSVPILRLAGEPVVTVGGADERDGYSIASLPAAVLLRDRIVIADGLASEIRFYDRSGNLVHRVGRAGAGPGEFRSIRHLVAVNDTTVAAWDPQLLRATLVTERRLITVTPKLTGAESMMPSFVGALASGELVFRDERGLMGMGDEPNGPRSDTITYYFVASNGETVGRVRVGGEETWLANDRKRWAREPIIFGRRVLEAIVAKGLVLGETDGLRFSLASPTGELRPMFQMQHQPTAATAGAIQDERQARMTKATQALARFAGQIVADGKPLDPSEFITTVIARLPAAANLPAYTALYGAGEDLWYCSEHLITQRCTRTTNGARAALLELPGGWRIHSFGAGEILVSVLDELERATVQVHRLDAAR